MDEREVFNTIVTQIHEVLPGLENHEFVYTDQLTALGANSVDRAEIVTLTLEALSLQIPRVELVSVKNIGELASAIYQKMQAST